MARPAALLLLASTACTLAACGGTSTSSGSSARGDASSAQGGAPSPTSTPEPSSALAPTSTAAASTTPGAEPTASPSASPAPADGGATLGGASANRCTSGELVGTLTFGPGAGAAGSENGTLTFRNDGGSPCTLEGYAGVSLVDRSGRQLGAPADRAETSPVRVVTLAPGGTATAALHVANAGNYSAGDCQPAAANGLRIYPPGSRTAIFVQHDLRGCATQAHLLSVGPVIAPAAARSGA